MKQLLNGVRIIDISAFAPVKFGTMIMADLGADVIQIERPPAAFPEDFPLLTSTEHPRWLWYSRNKRSLGLNLKSEEGLEVFKELAKTADIIVEGFAVGTARRLGIDYEAIKAIKPDIIYASVSGFGQAGPYAGFGGHEPNYQAMSGISAATGGPSRDPSILPVPVSDCVSSLYSVAGVLAALEQHRNTGRGAYLDISIQDTVLSLFGINAQYLWQMKIENPWDIKEFGGDPGSQVYPTADGGAVAVSAVEPWAWEKLCRVLGVEHLVEAFGATGTEAETVRSELADAFIAKDREEWREINDEHDLAVTPVMDFKEVLGDSHVRARGMVSTVPHETLGEARQVSTPILVDGEIPTPKWMPVVGEHTDEVLHEIGCSNSKIVRLRETGVAY